MSGKLWADSGPVHGPELEEAALPVLKLTEDLIPLSELKSRAAAVVRQAEETRRPIVLTRHGRGVAVVLSIAAFDELAEAARRRELQRAVEEGEEDIAAGREVGHEEIVAMLDRWSSGKR
jgi:prevent-host-death family protein